MLVVLEIFLLAFWFATLAVVVGLPEDLRGPFGEFGPLKDVYLPRDYYTGEPRGFGFVQYVDPDDAAEAKYHMDGQVLLGRELTVVFAEENRKKPSEMRARERSRGISYDRRGSSSRYSRSPGRGRSYHRSPSYYSPSPRRGRGRSYHRSPSYYSPSPRRGHERSYHRSPSYYSPSPRRGRYSRSISPRDRRYRERSYSRSRSPYGSVSRSPSPVRSRSPEGY
uniref:Putative nucleotide-binding alpha-beta plait domain-containing protein n=1 Tax=Helianthus annuus TaxID=4232 RepID=A0A251SR31_HELAN